VFDTDLAPSDSNAAPAQGRFEMLSVSGTSFLSSTWSVNGRSYASFTGTGQNQEIADLGDFAGGDSLTLTKIVWNYSPVQRNYYATIGLIAPASLVDFVQGQALAQPASALNASGPLSSCQCAVFWRDGATGQDGYALFTVSSVTYQGYAAPEPALAVLLLAACAGALAFRRRAVR